jgi:hypothetical protein
VDINTREKKADSRPRGNRQPDSMRSAEYDEDDFKTYGSDLWPAWYDPMVLRLRDRERREPGVN